MDQYYLKIRPALFLLAVAVVIFFPSSQAGASALGDRSLRISDAQSDAIGVTYTLGFTSNSSLNVGSAKILFCKNSPIVYDSCTPPSGFSSSSITVSSLGNQGITDFYLNPAPSNTVILSRPSTQILNPGQVSVILNGFHNPSEIGTFYARVYLYSTIDASGPYIDAGGFALSINENVTINTTVPPFLYFCAALSFSGYDCSTGTNFTSDFGIFNTGKTSTATSQFIIGTNAAYGIVVTTEGTTLTSGNNIIAGLTMPSLSQIGVSQFGFNLRANSNPSFGQDPVGAGSALINSDYNIVNKFKFQNGDNIVHSAGVVDAEKFTSSYITNIASNTAPGIYSTTITYICLGTF
jgi:hypothetical protein